jgi:shikimate kinase
MEHLKEISKIVYLKISYEDMEQRIGDVTDRGVAMPEGFTLRDLFDERAPLYEKYADVIIDEKGKTPAEIVREIKNWTEQIEKNI